MLWRVRTTLPDRPGALARLAAACGGQRVNILGLQIFPGVDAVTDELVLRTPEGWGMAEVAGLLESAGGRRVSGGPCTEAALVDQPTRYVQAARAVIAQPAAFTEVAAALFDAEADPVGALAPVQDVLEMAVGEVQVQVRRSAPFTATEHARAAALAGLVGDVLQRSRRPVGTAAMPAPGDEPAYVRTEQGLEARAGDARIGSAVLVEVPGEPSVRRVRLAVDAAWRRRGVGTRLLRDVSRVAGDDGVEELVLVTSADNQAVLPVVLAAGLRGRIRLTGEDLTVRVAVRSPRPARR